MCFSPLRRKTSKLEGEEENSRLVSRNEERSAAVSNVLRRLAQGMAGLEKAANSKYEANTPKRWHVNKFIARLPGGAQNRQW
jgi:hypothetical protein